MPMRSEEGVALRAGAKGARAVYLDMLDTHAADDVENAREPGIPVGHALLLAPIALIVGALGGSEILALAIFGVMLLWILCASIYYGHAYRRHRIAMGLPAGSLKHYLIRRTLQCAIFMAVWIGVQVLLRHLL